MRTTRQTWLIACDANMCPEEFKKSLWIKSRHMFVEAPGEGDSTCRSEGPNGEFIVRTYNYVIASHSLQGKIKNMEVVEDFEPRPHKAVTFSEEREKELQVSREQKKPKALPGFSGGKHPGRSKVGKLKRKGRAVCRIPDNFTITTKPHSRCGGRKRRRRRGGKLVRHYLSVSRQA